jgi:uncharacterized protein
MSLHTRTFKPRIDVVDALRGFALLGLCLIHGIEHFDLLVYPETAPGALQAIDPVVHGIVFFLFAGKAFAIFSFMFGLSFFIQMDRQAQRGVNFRWRFLWRLALLFAIGYLFGLAYCGEILTIFAVLGVALILFDKLGTRTLLAVSLLMVANIPYLYRFFVVLGEPALDPRPYAVWNLYGQAFEIFSQGSLAQVIQFNAWLGQQMKWGWYLQEGRIWQILGLFLWGMVIGRSRFFESIEDNKGLCRRFLVVSTLGFVALQTLKMNLDSFDLSENAAYLADKLVSSYANLMFTILLMTGFILLYGRQRWQRKLSLLAPLGRMSLTNYIGQSLVGVLFFYGFGFAMYRHFGYTLSLAFAAVLISALIWASRAWLQRFFYGPLEWAWRAATFMTSSVPFVRRHQE